MRLSFRRGSPLSLPLFSHLFPVIFVAACSTSNPHPPLARGTGGTPGSSAAGASGGGSGGAGGDGACAFVDDYGITVPIQLQASAPPAFAGGTVSDGTYYLTRITKFTGPGGATGSGGTHGHETWQFTDDAKTLRVYQGALPPSTSFARFNVHTSFAANTLSGAVTCSDGDGTWGQRFYETTSDNDVVAAEVAGDGSTVVYYFYRY